mgnify:CR=1 FL=1
MLWTVIAFLCGVSCSKVERVFPEALNEITFEPIDMPESKADDETYPEGEIFGMYAYYSACPGDVVFDAAEAWPMSSLYFEDAAFARNGAIWAGYDPQSGEHKPYYWPFEGSLMFVGYSPHSSQYGGQVVKNVTLTSENHNGVNPYLEITFVQNEIVKEMVDLMWFDVKDVNSGKTLARTETAVNMIFKHALSKVSLEFNDSHGIYRIKDVCMKNCINSAIFYSGKTAGWMPLADGEGRCDLKNYILPVTKAGEEWPLMSEWNTSDALPLLIIPQYMDGVYPTLGSGTLDTGGDVILEFTITDGFGEQTVEVLMKDHTDRWESGKHYKYTVTVNADPIDFGTPSVTITTQTVSM